MPLPIDREPYNINYEMANTLTAGIGILFGIVALPVLMFLAVQHGGVKGVVGCSIFAFGFLMMFSASTVYHATSNPQAKAILHVYDHIAIFLMIGGTYAPLVLEYLSMNAAIWFLSIQWGLILVGIVLKIFFTGRYNGVSTAVYLILGWMVVFVGNSIYQAASATVMWLVVVGGLSYTVGVGFYVWKSLPGNHAIWHVFILGGAITHYVAIVALYV